jgi:alkyl hydroperoxide reductase subunit AhpC
MKRFLPLALFALTGTLLAQAPPKTHLKGGTASLSDFKGKSTVVLAFFPAAFTGG